MGPVLLEGRDIETAHRYPLPTPIEGALRRLGRPGRRLDGAAVATLDPPAGPVVPVMVAADAPDRNRPLPPPPLLVRGGRPIPGRPVLLATVGRPHLGDEVGGGRGPLEEVLTID